MYTRKLKKSGIDFVLTFDEYQTLDELKIKKGDTLTNLPSTNKHVKFFVNNQEAIFNVQPLKQVTYTL